MKEVITIISRCKWGGLDEDRSLRDYMEGLRSVRRELDVEPFRDHRVLLRGTKDGIVERWELHD